MKTILKILIAIAVLNAAGRVGLAAAGYYQLKDKTQELVTFGGQTSPVEIQEEILQTAIDLDLPVDAEDIEVTRDGLHTPATASYTQPVEVFPSYRYPINFSFAVEALAMSGLSGQPAALRN